MSDDALQKLIVEENVSGKACLLLQEAFERAVDDYLLNCARMGRSPERPYPRLAC